MSIGCCDCCDASDVPVSSLVDSTGCDVTACFRCQGDEFDPYCEMEVEGYDGEGTILVRTEPVTLDDLEERDEEEARAASKVRKDAIMAGFDATIAAIRAAVEIAAMAGFIGAVALWSGIASHSI